MYLFKKSETNLDFKKNHSLFKRREESKRILNKYPNRIPIIVNKTISSDILEIDKHKYLAPSDLTMGQFVYVIRKRINLNPERSLYLFCNNVLPATSAPLSQVYSNHKDEDGFLYITYAAENTFG